MTTKHLYTLNDISLLLDIPKSTLRYWEKEQLITSHRKESQYREYTTEQLIQICEIKIYRDLNFSIKDIKDIDSNDQQTNIDILNKAKETISQQIKTLQQTIKDIERYEKKHALMLSLKRKPIQKERPFFNELYYFHPVKTPNLINYIKDPSIMAFVQDPTQEKLQHFATFVKESAVQPLDTFWVYSDDFDYFTTYITSINKQLDTKRLDFILSTISDLGYTSHKTIGRFLVSEKKVDYYQVWIEAKKR
mgnify:CR=1 FL=1